MGSEDCKAEDTQLIDNWQTPVKRIHIKRKQEETKRIYIHEVTAPLSSTSVLIQFNLYITRTLRPYHVIRKTHLKHFTWTIYPYLVFFKGMSPDSRLPLENKSLSFTGEPSQIDMKRSFLIFFCLTLI